MSAQELSPRSLGVEAGFFKPTRAEYSLSVGVSVTINALFFWIFFTPSAKPPADPESPLDDVQWVALTALGEPAPPKAVPRIVAPPPPPPPESEAVSLSREVKPEPKKPKPKPEPKKPEPKKRPPKAKTTPPKRAQKKRPERKVTLDSLFSSSDERADRGPRRGSKTGHAEGTSTQDLGSREMSLYISRLSTTISRRLAVPNAIAHRTDLKAVVFFKIGKNLKIKGEPRWVQRSGSRLFDDAVMKALEAFTLSGPGKLPLPSEAKERQIVLQKGVKLIITPPNR